MGNLLRRYESGPNSPDFSLLGAIHGTHPAGALRATHSAPGGMVRRFNYAPQNRENLFSLSYLAHHDNHHPATSLRSEK
jgi:hypothetical protein